MPRPRPPPTPSSSTDLKAAERSVHSSDLDSGFVLPPPALRSEGPSQPDSSKSASQRAIQTGAASTTQRTPPVSPKDKPLTSSPRQKRTASGMMKPSSGNEPVSTTSNAGASYALPPPPSRARKIIQMKPKSHASKSHPSPDSDASYHPPTSTPASSSGSKVTGATAANSKRKQPSATSAAGRKIARKTAHSIIERRRRSKMNEEFGVLKDMIPACEGVEMHKLAILQAGIEYVRYLEGCVKQLKTENARNSEASESSPANQPPRLRYANEIGAPDHAENEDDEDEDMEDDQLDREEATHLHDSYSHRPQSSTSREEWTFRDARKTSEVSQNSSAYPSPYLHGRQPYQTEDPLRGPATAPPTSMGSYTASPSHISTYAAAPTQLSPAFNSIHFSPDLLRNQPTTSGGASGTILSSSGSWAVVNPSSGSKPSPQMAALPSPEAAMHLPLPPQAKTLQLPQPYATVRDEDSRSPAAMSDASGTAEATATAALMMLTNDWRATAGIGAVATKQASVELGAARDKGKGMSVRDLLSS